MLLNIDRDIEIIVKKVIEKFSKKLSRKLITVFVRN
jgi:hypothetical protein